MWLNDASYNDNFSSVLRLSRGAQLSRKIVERDYDGRAPLPKYLEKSTIRFFEDGRAGNDVEGAAVHTPLQMQSGNAEGGSLSASSVQVQDNRSEIESASEEGASA